MTSKITTLIATATLTFIGVSSLFTSVAKANPAYVSGSYSAVLMNGATQSLGGELSSNPGTSLGSTVTITIGGGPALNTNATTALATSLTVTPETTSGTVASPGLTFTQAAATTLNQYDAGVVADLDDVVSIIRAGAGVDGLD